MSFIRLCMAALLLLCVSHGYGQQVIYVSKAGIAKVLRVNIGFTTMRMSQQDSAARKAMGIHLSNEFKVISAFRDYDETFSIYDAFYFDINLAKMSNEPHRYGDETESKFSVSTNFGYNVLAGYRNEEFSALGGIDFRWSRLSVGGLDMPNLNGPLFYYYMPIALRGEYAFKKGKEYPRVALMTWQTLNIKRDEVFRSVRLELSLGRSGNWWICSQHTLQKGLVQDNFMMAQAVPGKYGQFMIGIRKGVSP